jgi:uncharacterized protein (TIGR03086 family)
MDQIELLEGVLTKTGDVLAGVRADQSGRPTPCDQYDVETLVNHIVGWIHVFEAASQGRTYDGDASTYQHGEDPASEFRSAAGGVVDGWREHGLDRKVRLGGGETPGEMVFDMTLMEYLTHGMDLAVATGQPVPYTETEAAETLTRAEKTLPPEYRGDNMPFGPAVPIADDAPAVDRLAAFLGRRPGPAEPRSQL